MEIIFYSIISLVRYININARGTGNRWDLGMRFVLLGPDTTGPLKDYVTEQIYLSEIIDRC